MPRRVGGTSSRRHDVSGTAESSVLAARAASTHWHSLCSVLLRGSTRPRAMNESRRFVGRPGAVYLRLPPGQHLTRDFPVLSAGPTPHVPLEQWELTIDDGMRVLRRWSWKSFRELPIENVTADL